MIEILLENLRTIDPTIKDYEILEKGEGKAIVRCFNRQTLIAEISKDRIEVKRELKVLGKGEFRKLLKNLLKSYGSSIFKGIDLIDFQKKLRGEWVRP